MKRNSSRRNSKIGHRRENFVQMRGLRSTTKLLSSSETQRKIRVQKESRIRNAAAILTNQDIYHERKKGNISIYPFHTRCLTDTSYFVTMGENYYVSRNRGEYVNPWNKRRLQDHWDGPYKAITVKDGEMFEKCGIPIEKKAIIIPGETSILAHTQEFIGGLNYIAGEIRGKMILAYGGLTILNECTWLGMGNIDRKTLVIRNNSKSPTVVPVGAKIAQVVFHYTGLPKFFLKGDLQSAENLETVVKNWNPSLMLPKPPSKQFSLDKLQNPDLIEKPTEDYDPEEADEPYKSESEEELDDSEEDERSVSLD